MKDNNFDIIIIGAGAAGLSAALSIKEAAAGKKVLVLEKNQVSGKKLSRTGNGRCNFTNRDLSAEYYNSTDKEKVKGILDAFTLDESLSFFSKKGMPWPAKSICRRKREP